MKPYRLAFLGYNAKLTECGLWEFVQNNKEQIANFDRTRNIVRLIDGTIIQGVLGVDPVFLRGSRFDQLILFDDERWQIYYHRSEDIGVIIERMCGSIVPEEFQVLEYEL